MQLGAIPLAQVGASLAGAAGTLGTALVRRAASAITPDGQPAAPGSGPSISAIENRYDLRDITPRKFSELIETLSAAGALSPSELDDLRAIRAQLTSEQIDTDERIDLVAFLREKIAESADATSSNRPLSADDSNPAAAASSQRHLELISRLEELIAGRPAIDERA